MLKVATFGLDASSTLISTPGVHVDPRHTFCEIFFNYFTICSLFFCQILCIPLPFICQSSWRQNITYLGLAQKPVHTILHWGPRGPQTHQFWKTMQAWVWLLTYLSLLLGNYSHVTRERSSRQFLADHTATVWLAIGIIISVRPSVCRSVTLCIVVVTVSVQD